MNPPGIFTVMVSLDYKYPNKTEQLCAGIPAKVD